MSRTNTQVFLSFSHPGFRSLHSDNHDELERIKNNCDIVGWIAVGTQHSENHDSELDEALDSRCSHCGVEGEFSHYLDAKKLPDGLQPSDVVADYPAVMRGGGYVATG